MKGIVKCIIAGTVIIVIGIAVLLTALALNGWSFSSGVTYETRTYRTADDIAALDVELNLGAVKTQFYNGDEFIIEYPVASGLTANVYTEGGKLCYSNHAKWFAGLRLRNIPETVISIPSGRTIDLDVELNAGTITVAAGVYGNIDIEVNAGTLKAVNVACERFSGEVNAGVLKIEGIVCRSFDGEVSAGTLQATGLDCAAIRAEVSAGSAKLALVGAASDYTVRTTVHAGSCNIGNSTATTGNGTIEAEVSAGSLNITFAG